MTGFALRRATPADVAAIAVLFRRVRQAALPYLPDLHTPDEDRAFFGGVVLPESVVWLAESERLVGFIAIRPGWVDHLYVDPAHHGQGVGSALLDKAFASEAELRLWVFQKNAAAIRFYERRGFRLVEATDGAHNEEKEPDALYFWQQPTSGQPPARQPAGLGRRSG